MQLLPREFCLDAWNAGVGIPSPTCPPVPLRPRVVSALCRLRQSKCLPQQHRAVGAPCPRGLKCTPVHRCGDQAMLRCEREDFQGCQDGVNPSQGPTIMAIWELLLRGPAHLCPQLGKPRRSGVDPYFIHSDHSQRERYRLPSLKIRGFSLPDIM